MCTLLSLYLSLSPVVVLSPGNGGNRGKKVQRMEVAEEGDSEERVVVSMPQLPAYCQRIFNLSAGPRAPRAKLEGL